MTSLATGTVAFLMSDIEGSTRLIAVVGDAFPSLLDEHNALMRAAIGDQGGTVVSSEGDSVFAVFPSARLAIAAAINAQRALAGHAWPPEASVRVRIGIHAGEATLSGRAIDHANLATRTVYGRMFRFTRNRLAGSYFALIVARRA